MASVLVVEDDQFVRSALIRHLSEASHTVRSVGTALEALREVAHFRFDVVVLDLGLPDLDGGEALKMLRSITDVPVIIATARDDESEIVRLLNDGADDYLTKPFSVEHLSARMAAVLRRARASGEQAPPPRVIRVGGLAIDPLRRSAELDGAQLDLTRREFDLLTFLAGRPGVVVARKELLAEVWQQSYGDDQTIDVHLSWLRRKLGETAARPRYLHTLRGVGVKLQPPADTPPSQLPSAQPPSAHVPPTRTSPPQMPPPQIPPAQLPSAGMPPANMPPPADVPHPGAPAHPGAHPGAPAVEPPA
ncbi:DNA-binding response regulator [Streptomyces sp. ZL-24]|nr:DNA-binding response regulator [Streptomyces sp. ZL-24]